MNIISCPETHVFQFDRQNWEDWKIGGKLPSFYRHHDGTCHFFEGVAMVDQMRRTREGAIEVVVREYRDEEAAARPWPHEHIPVKSGVHRLRGGKDPDQSRNLAGYPWIAARRPSDPENR